MAIILKDNKVNLFVSSVLFVFWYHSPNILDTLHICNISWLRVKEGAKGGKENRPVHEYRQINFFTKPPCMFTYMQTVKHSAKACPLGKEVLVMKAEIVSKTAGVLSYRNSATYRRAVALHSHISAATYIHNLYIFMYMKNRTILYFLLACRYPTAVYNCMQ
jgi:hypothetical protein